MTRYLLILLLCCSMVRGADVTISTAASTDDVYYRQAAGLSTTGTTVLMGKNVSGLQYNVGLRFLNVTIAAGSTIDTVILNLVSAGSSTSTTVNVRASCHDTSDANTFSDTTNFKARARTTAHLDWALPSVTSNATYRYGGSTGNLKSPVQEVVDLAGWASGNDLAFLIDENGTTASNRTRSWYTYDIGGDGTLFPTVTIYYTTPSGVQNVYHGIAGVGVRHSIAGNSSLHKK